MDSRYQRGRPGEDQCVARCARIVGRHFIPNLVANDAPTHRVNHRGSDYRVLLTRLEGIADIRRSEAIVGALGGLGALSDCARRLGDLEQ